MQAFLAPVFCSALLCMHAAAKESPSPAWSDSVREQIESAEYSISNISGSRTAPNRAHGFRTRFDSDGVSVSPRLSGETDWVWGLSLRSWGDEAGLEAVEPTEPVVTGNRAEYHRGDIVEWYVNGSAGLEQGFEVSKPPQAGGAQLRLVVEMSGNLSPALSDGADSVALTDPDGRLALSFGKLLAADATGTKLPAVFELCGRHLAIRVNIADAVFPITIDPIATSPVAVMDGSQANELFGFSVNTAGDVNGDGYADVIVGAYGYDGGSGGEGRAFVYPGSSSGVSTTALWSVVGVSNSLLGRSVSTAGDVNGDGYADIIVGSHNYSGFGFLNQNIGKAEVFYGSSSGPSVSSDWVSYGSTPLAQAGQQFGYSVACAGDVDGNGFSDVIVGAWKYNNGTTNDVGRAFVFHGSSTGLSTSADWTYEGVQANEQLGCSVDTAGDVNGDHSADVVIGAQGYDSNDGRILVFHGASVQGLGSTYSWMEEGFDALSEHGIVFGYSVSTAGDVNGDGYADIIASAHLAGTNQEGKACVFHGSSGGMTFPIEWSVSGGQDYAWYGQSVNCAGDVNGDGYADVIVGAPSYDGVGNNSGRAYVYLGSGAGLNTAEYWMQGGDAASDNFGRSVNTAGDVNGDGFSDIAVGADGYGDGGRAYVYISTPNGPSDSDDWEVYGNNNNHLGSALQTAGDVNGDGYADVIVGAELYDWGQSNDGRAFLYFGSPTGLSMSADWDADGLETNAYFGQAIGTAGDVNGDGFSELLVGAPQADGVGTDRGAARMYCGNSSMGNPLTARQLQPTAGVSLSPEGISDTVNGFNIRATVNTTPLGRGYFKLEWQVAPVGHSFDESKAVSGESIYFNMTTPGGTTLTEEVRNLGEVGPYHWRFRLKYPSGSPLGLLHSRWINIPQWGGEIRDLKIGGAELRITQTSVSGATASNEWTSLTGASYQLQETDSLATGTWNDVGGVVTAQGRNCSTTVTVNTSAKTFYRVKLNNVGL